MTSRLFALTMFLICLALPCTSDADVITFGGTTYQSVDWTSVNATTDIATGSAAGTDVTLSTIQITSQVINLWDYQGGQSAGAYDALSYSTGLIENIIWDAGEPGTTQISFSQSVDSLLLLIGNPTAPSGSGPGTNWNIAEWDFDDLLEISVLDANVDTTGGDISLIVDGNRVVRKNPLFSATIFGDSAQGVLLVNGPLNSLSFVQSPSDDTFRVALAVAVPEPASGILGCFSLISLCSFRIRNRQRSRATM